MVTEDIININDIVTVLNNKVTEIFSVLNGCQQNFSEEIDKLKNACDTSLNDNFLNTVEDLLDSTFDQLEVKYKEVKESVNKLRQFFSNDSLKNVQLTNNEELINQNRIINFVKCDYKNNSQQTNTSLKAIVVDDHENFQNYIANQSTSNSNTNSNFFISNNIDLTTPIVNLPNISSSDQLLKNDYTNVIAKKEVSTLFVEKKNKNSYKISHLLSNSPCCSPISENSVRNAQFTAKDFTTSNSSKKIVLFSKALSVNNIKIEPQIEEDNHCLTENLNNSAEALIKKYNLKPCEVVLNQLDVSKAIENWQNKNNNNNFCKLDKIFADVDKLLNSIEKTDNKSEDDNSTLSNTLNFNSNKKKKIKKFHKKKRCMINSKIISKNKLFKKYDITNLPNNSAIESTNTVKTLCNVDENDEIDNFASKNDVKEFLNNDETNNLLKNKSGYDKEIKSLLNSQIVISSSEEEDRCDKNIKKKKRKLSENRLNYENLNNNIVNNYSINEIEKNQNKKRLHTMQSHSESSTTSESTITKKFFNKKANNKRSKLKSKHSDFVSNLEDEFLTSDNENESSAEEAKTFCAQKIIVNKDITQTTINIEKAEKERRKRLKEKQLEFNGIELVEDNNTGELHIKTANSFKHSKIKSLTLDNDEKSENPCVVKVHDAFISLLKPHQAEGIMFMYNCAIESLNRIKIDEHYGGILAHCMGLGKTFQVIVFLYSILTHPKISKVLKRVMILGPKNVLTHWESEFKKWMKINVELEKIDVYEIVYLRTIKNRLEIVKKWFNSTKPSILIASYDMYRLLIKHEENSKENIFVSQKNISKKEKKQGILLKIFNEFATYLKNPGPDLLICDEGHLLKNDETSLYKKLSKIRTKRRICLTGTPIQNNLKEYYTMVNFVKPGILGTKSEFSNRFSNIINRGRSSDATQADVKLMKRRCHVLYETLREIVQRKDFRVLVEAIPPKQEYVIYVRLTECQRKLYQAFLDNHVDITNVNKCILADSHILNRICCHPFLLELHKKEVKKKRMLNDNNKCAGISASSSNSDCSEIYNNFRELPSTSKKAFTKKDKNILVNNSNVALNKSAEWYSQYNLISADDKYNFELSNKLVLLIQIIKHCEEIGDKLLIFSQSLESLRFICETLTYLAKNDQWFVNGHEALMARGEKWCWKLGKDYLIINGSVNAQTRNAFQDQFNDPLNLRARLMLISTQAGSLGTNLITANRVVIFDACWNPTYDKQALFRVYRYGQIKPVYVYRLISQGTMEERVYKRQVVKESTSKRVIEEAQIQRHFCNSELGELYMFNPIKEKDQSLNLIKRLTPTKDRLLSKIILSHGHVIVNYIQHDSLFDEIEEEKLTDRDRKEAWEDFEREKNGILNVQNSISNVYKKCFIIPNMSHDIASKVLYIKQLLSKLLPSIPLSLRGPLENFDTYFYYLIEDIFRKNETPLKLLEQTIYSFQTTVAIVRGEKSCCSVLQELYSKAPQLFVPLQQSK